MRFCVVFLSGRLKVWLGVIFLYFVSKVWRKRAKVNEMRGGKKF